MPNRLARENPYCTGRLYPQMTPSGVSRISAGDFAAVHVRNLWTCSYCLCAHAHIIEDNADKEIEGDAEEVDDGGAQLLGHVLASHLHHRGPKQAHAEFEHAKRRQL